MIESVSRLLELATGRDEPGPRRSQHTPGFELVLSPAIVARTVAAGVPDDATRGDPPERPAPCTLPREPGYLMSMLDDAHLPESDRSAPEQPPEALTAHDWSAGVDLEGSGDLRAAISNAMVGLKKRFYGKGPERARTYFNDNYVFCAMEGGLTRNEQTLVEAGEQDAVRNYRLLFEKVMDRPTIQAVEQLTGRHVIGYHSQVTFNPTRSLEIFVLDSAPDWRQPANRRA
jgi:uncharacterized protein YbcI